MKARFLTTLVLIVILVSGTCCAEELIFEKYYLVLPELDLRANPSTPGKVDTIYAGQEVVPFEVVDTWATFTYVKDGEQKIGCTWVGAIALGVRIHLLEDEYIFNRPEYDRQSFGTLVAWREPSDPDLIVLWEETVEDGSKWLYVVCLDTCRSGYMRREASFEIVE